MLWPSATYAKHAEYAFVEYAENAEYANMQYMQTKPYMQKTCDVAEKAILAKKKLRKKCVNRDKM